MRGSSSITIGIFLAAFPYTVAASASCALAIREPFSALSLYDQDLFHRMTEEEACQEKSKPCFEGAPKPRSENIAVYKTPSGKKLADLKVDYVVGTGLSAWLLYGNEKHPISPIIYDADWGYGLWFHVTLVDMNGDWKKIVLPRIGSGWIKRPNAEIFKLLDHKEWVYAFRGRHIKIIEADGKKLTVRDEQPSDNLCEETDPPPLAAFDAQSLPFEEFYDDQCNLQITPINLRGC